MSRRIVRGSAALALVLALAGCSAPGGPPAAPEDSAVVGDQRVLPTPTPSSAPASSSPSARHLDRDEHSTDDPSSIWVVVDKRRPLQPKTWVPRDLVTPAVPHTNVPQLRRVAAHALTRMFAAAKRDGITLVSLSAYRAFASQQRIFDRNVAKLGRATTLQLTAKPGFSEHQTGLADDIGDGSTCDLRVCFESHPAAKWLSAHAWQYGFIQRFPLGYTPVTGIQVEPWHYRYVGTALSREMRATGVKTLEQFFDLPSAPDY